MSIDELAEELNLSPNYILKNWNAVVARYESQGTRLMRRGRGESASYGILKRDEVSVKWVRE